MLGWPRFVWIVLVGLGGIVGLLAMFVLLLNPYGNLPHLLFDQHAIADTNQRFQYPALIRSKRYDSIVIGASDSRLLHPRALERVFGGRFANLAMDAGLAYEQYRMASLFIEEVKNPRTLMVGLDRAWCKEDADEERITSRGFPEWMYDADWRNDLRYMLNVKTVEISARRLEQALGFMEARLPDGYEAFTPHESAYDPAKVERRLWGKAGREAIEPLVPPYRASAEERAQWRFPALAWLEEVTAKFPGRVVFVFVPAHIAAQAKPGSEPAAQREECKERIAAIAQRHNVPFVDFDIRSELTANDGNWWDRLHYRLPIADRVVAGIERALATGKDDPTGDWRYLAGPRAGAISATAQ